MWAWLKLLIAALADWHIADEWYHFKKSRHVDTMWFGLFARRMHEFVSTDLRPYMSFYVDRGRVEIDYRVPFAA